MTAPTPAEIADGLFQRVLKPATGEMGTRQPSHSEVLAALQSHGAACAAKEREKIARQVKAINAVGYDGETFKKWVLQAIRNPTSHPGDQP